MQTAARPISAVLNDLVGNIQQIARSEVRLAKVELGEEAVKLRSAGIMLGVGVLLAGFGMLFVLLAIVHALSLVMAVWAAALVVGATVGTIAVLCCGAGIRRIKAVRAAPKSIDTVKENVEWAKHPTR